MAQQVKVSKHENLSVLTAAIRTQTFGPTLVYFDGHLHMQYVRPNISCQIFSDTGEKRELTNLYAYPCLVLFAVGEEMQKKEVSG